MLQACGMRSSLLQVQRIELLGSIERFWDQDDAMCDAGTCFIMADNQTKTAIYFQRARDVGAASSQSSVDPQPSTLNPKTLNPKP